MEDKLIANILEYLEEHLYDNPTVDDIANQFHFNRFTIMRGFKNATGLTIMEYLNERKIVKSINDLLKTDHRILKIALDHGYHSLEYYSEIFYRLTGISPLQFKNNYNQLSLLQTGDLKECLEHNHKQLNKLRLQNNSIKQKSLSSPKVLKK